MRCFETINGSVKTDYELKEMILVVYGRKINSDAALDYWLHFMAGIDHEITDFTTWKEYAKTSLVDGVKLYRALTGCGLSEAHKMVSKEREEK